MSDSFDRVVEIMATLRAPGGCPWDRKQTHESLRPYLLEETYEVLETIDQRETTKLKEELGDILLQVLFHSQIATEEGTFTVNDVVQQLGDKLIRRHPHVFHDPVSDKEAMNADQVVHRWEEIKRAERQASGKSESVLQDVPKALPALLRAFQVQARAARVGFDWPDNPQGLKQVFDKIEEELRELRDAWSSRHEQAEITSSAPRPVPQPAGRRGRGIRRRSFFSGQFFTAPQSQSGGRASTSHEPVRRALPIYRRSGGQVRPFDERALS